MSAKVGNTSEKNNRKVREVRQEYKINERCNHASSFKTNTKCRQLSVYCALIFLSTGHCDPGRPVIWYCATKYQFSANHHVA